MSLSYSKLAGDDSHKIAEDGEEKIYYNYKGIDLTEELEDEEALDTITNVVDRAIMRNKVRVGMKDAIKLDLDVLLKEPPSNKYTKKVYRDAVMLLKRMESKVYKGENVMVTPRGIENQVDRIYISGSSGAGKSTWIGKYIGKYLETYPNNRVILFSRKSNDPVLDPVFGERLERIPIDRKFLTDVDRVVTHRGYLESFRNSLIVFDDIEDIDDNDLKRAVRGLVNDAMKLGRQFGVSTILVSHKGLGGQETKIALVECTHVVVFPRLNLGEASRMIEKYCYYTKEQMKEIFGGENRMKRWLCVIKPDIIVTEDEIKII